jgi:hypothetical protein
VSSSKAELGANTLSIAGEHLPEPFTIEPVDRRAGTDRAVRTSMVWPTLRGCLVHGGAERARRSVITPLVTTGLHVCTEAGRAISVDTTIVRIPTWVTRAMATSWQDLQSRLKRVITAVLLVAAAELTAGCVSGYRYPDTKVPTATESAPRSLPTAHNFSVSIVPPTQRAVFLEAMRSSGAQPLEAPTAPARGRFVRITVREVPASPGAQGWGMLASTTCFIIPAYSESSGYDVSFDTFLDGQPIHHYAYEARATVWAWVALTPVVWVNLLTPSRHEAFAGITRRFLADSAKWGFRPVRGEAVHQIVIERNRPAADALEEELPL